MTGNATGSVRSILRYYHENMVSALGQLRSINRNGGQTTYVPVSASTALFPRYDQILVKTHYFMLSHL